MAGVVLLLGLIAAGIYTGNSVFYILAGVLGGLAFLAQLWAVAMFSSVKKEIDRDFKHFGDTRNIGNSRRRF